MPVPPIKNSSLSQPMRLGYAVKILARPDLKSNDTRRHQSNPHLRTSIEYLHPIFDHLAKTGVDMYRMSSDIAPYLTHPDLPQFHNQIAEARPELETLGAKARELGLRLSFHPSQFILLNAPDPKLVAQSVKEITAQSEMLDIMGLGPEAVVVTHVGGHYGDPAAGKKRWADTWRTLPEPARRRLVLENDDIRFSAADVLDIHAATGVKLVFDHQHHYCLNPLGLAVRPTLERMLATWPSGVRPKVHYSSPRTEMRELERKDKDTGKKKVVPAPPIWTGHADFVNPVEFSLFLDVVAGLPAFDIMVEAKSKDLAVLRLKADIPRFAPGHAGRFGLAPAAAEPLEADEGD